MRVLLEFLHQIRLLLFLLFLELMAVMIMLKFNHFYQVAYLETSSQFAGNFHHVFSKIRGYFALEEANTDLRIENARIARQYIQLLVSQNAPPSQVGDSVQTIPARVINHSYLHSKNHLTLDKGSGHGVSLAMGVVTPEGAVGIMQHVSKNFSLAVSLLHRELMVSSMVKSTGTLCTTQWDGLDYRYSKVRFIPRHIPISVGDSIITSGYNATFPKGILIGVISSLELPGEATFYEVWAKLACDFSSLDHVLLFGNQGKQEKDSLEATL